MKQTSPTFGERRAKLEAVAATLANMAETLAAYATLLADEASRMRAVEARYAAAPHKQKATQADRSLPA